VGSGNGPSEVLTDSWDGVSWSPAPAPTSPAGYVAFADVSCTSPNACTAVGGTNSAPAAEALDGAGWAVMPVSGPAGSLDPFLDGVSCTSPAACIAVGYYDNNSDPAQGALAERWNGSTWTIIQSAGPAQAPPGSQPILYNPAYGATAAWTYPKIKPAWFILNQYGDSAAVIRLHWAHWNSTTAVTSSATYEYLTGPCCAAANWRYENVTVTLSDVQHSYGLDPRPYFGRIVITGHGIRTITRTYVVSQVNGTLTGTWTGSPA
jgi:hypothetical protein